MSTQTKEWTATYDDVWRVVNEWRQRCWLKVKPKIDLLPKRDYRDRETPEEKAIWRSTCDLGLHFPLDTATCLHCFKNVKIELWLEAERNVRGLQQIPPASGPDQG